MTQPTQGIQASAAPLPRDRCALLQTLLSGVERIAPIIERNKTASEHARTLAPEVVEAMRDVGLLMMKSPYEVGGAEIHPVDQMEVVEAVTYLDSAAAWSMFIAATVTGRALSALSNEAVDELFAGGLSHHGWQSQNHPVPPLRSMVVFSLWSMGMGQRCTPCRLCHRAGPQGR